MVLFQFF